jgi:hypothetical protein
MTVRGCDVSGLGSSTIEYHKDKEGIELEKNIGSLDIVRIVDLSTHRAFHFEVDQPPQGG